MTPSNGTYISTATTTVVKASPGILRGIVISETAAGAVTVYDNTSAAGTIVAVFKASIVEGDYPLNIRMSTGITVVTAGASKVTVIWE